MLATLNRHVVQPLMAWRSGSKHLQYLKLLKQTQYDDPELIRRRQWLAVRRLLKHAYETVPFYRARFDTAGLHPADFNSLDDLARLPVLTKTDIRANGEALRSEAYRGGKLTLKKTSGSTGVPLCVALDEASLQWKRACTIRSDEWSGWRLGGRVAKVWGNPDYLKHGWKGRVRNRFIDRATCLDTINVSQEGLAGFVRGLRARQPSLLFGHAHSLYLLACFVRKTGRGGIRPDGIISTSMPLHDWQRAVIEEVFGRPATDRYGCEEASLIASECEIHRGLHLNADSVYAEIEADDRLHATPNTGKLLVTDLTNFAMPLIRYRVGDVVVGSERRCPCGRGLPLLEKVQGREADYVLTPSGRLISGISLTESFALNVRGAAQVQIVQESLGFVRLRMVADGQFDESSREQVRALVRDLFGPEVDHELELVESIPQEPSGKYRFCISPVADKYLREMAA